MAEKKKLCLIVFVVSTLILGLLPSVFAVQNYDQTVYKVDSNYKNNYENREPSYEKCCGKNYYTLHSKCSYNSLRWESNYEKRIYNQKSYLEKSYQKNKKGFLGTYVKEYTVEIKNTGKTGEYFIVDFEFKDKNGFEFTQSVTNYIKTGETEKFVYRDVQFEKNEILRWSYNIRRVN